MMEHSNGINSGSIFSGLPANATAERFDELVKCDTLKIERIVSKGQQSPPSGWYDQADHEWVMIVQGEAELLFDDQTWLRLHAGDYVTIPAHKKHKVSWTDPNQETVWLAVFYR